MLSFTNRMGQIKVEDKPGSQGVVFQSSFASVQ